MEFSIKIIKNEKYTINEKTKEKKNKFSFKKENKKK